MLLNYLVKIKSLNNKKIKILKNFIDLKKIIKILKNL